MYKLLDGTSFLHMARLLCPRTQSSSGYLPQICRREGQIIYEFKKGGHEVLSLPKKLQITTFDIYVYIYENILYVCYAYYSYIYMFRNVFKILNKYVYT